MNLVAPKGAFYAHPSLDIPEDDLTFVTALLKEKHVLVVHGSGFGQKPGTHHMRIVFLPQEPVLSAAYEAMTEFNARALRRGLNHGFCPKSRFLGRSPLGMTIMKGSQWRT